MHQHIRGHKLFIIELLWMLGIASLSFLVVSHLAIFAASPRSHTTPFDASGDWSRFLYSDMHQGNNPNESILNTGNASSLTLKWKFKTPGALIAEPIIVNGIIYQGSNDGNMYAINATTHQQLWQTFLGRHSISTCPVSYGITGTAAV
ncbi:MAG TPA: PQQ-binding-like beta-propeller repeat protein, partial [Ktedonobacteraceae bacterium]|nr:PQQ-binding-like beta-propeller repeat protein [Ktedonobacteraceae bacterium]